MRIYWISGQNINGVFEHHFATTKASALAIAAEIVEGTEHEASVDVVNVSPTRAGIVHALNDFISAAALNEG